MFGSPRSWPKCAKYCRELVWEASTTPVAILTDFWQGIDIDQKCRGMNACNARNLAVIIVTRLLLMII